jgi:kynurenine formamidase
MIDLDKYRMVDLSPRMVARIKRLSGDIEEGNTDATGLPWVLEEGIADYDNTKYTWIGGLKGDEVWPWRISGHFGSHTEGGKGHLDHWEGLPDNVLGLWEYPLETFIGPAAVCNLNSLEPVEGKNDKGEKVLKGQAVTPDHLSNVQEGDIVLMGSDHGSDISDAAQPYIPRETAEWLAQKKIKMLAVQMPGLIFDTDYQAPQPNNSPTHRNMLGNNIAITYPLVNITSLKRDRVFYIGFPLSVERLDATWIRAIAFEER